jgi:hypothetical protein
MKTLEECKDEVAIEYGCSDWNQMYFFVGKCSELDEIIDKLMSLYAKEVAKQALIDASYNLESNNCHDYGSNCDLDAHRKQILNTPINLS